MRLVLPGLALLAVLTTGCCDSCESTGTSAALQDVTSVSTAMPKERLQALEEQALGVGQKLAWSGRYFQGRTVESLNAQGADLFAQVFNPETREYEMHCVDLASGTPRWILVMGSERLRYPPLGGDRFVSLIQENGAGTLVVNRLTGAREFKMTTALQVIPADSAASTESTLYVGSLVDSRIHALSPESGRSGWSHRTNGTISTGPLVTPRIPRRVVAVGTDAGEVHAYPATGWHEPRPSGPLWTRRLLGDVNGEMAVAELTKKEGVTVSLLVPCEDNGLYCLDVATGEPRWTARGESPFQGSPRAAGGRVYARNAARLVVLDLESGQEVFGSGLGTGGNFKEFELYDDVLAGDMNRAYLRTNERKVGRLNGKSGELEASQFLDLFDMVVPTGEKNLLLAATRDGYLVATH